MSKIKLIIFLILPFILAIPSHFIYNYIPFPILGIYFPVNESIFEHVKLTFTPTIITCLSFFLLNKRLSKQKLLSSLILSVCSSFVLMLSLYYLSLAIFKTDIVIISISCLLFATIVGQLVGLYAYKKNLTWSIDLSIYILVTMTLTLLILTINPPISDFFMDKS